MPLRVSAKGVRTWQAGAPALLVPPLTPFVGGLAYRVGITDRAERDLAHLYITVEANSRL